MAGFFYGRNMLNKLLDTSRTARNQVPASIKQAKILMPNWVDGFEILNFGCGRYWRTADSHLFRQLGAATVTHYDPFSLEAFYPYRYIEEVQEKFFDVVFVANVLNVLNNYGLDKTLEQLATINSDKFIIQIYEGKKNGRGSLTRDGYQRNERTEEYREKIHNAFGDSMIERKGNVLIVDRY